MIVFYFIINFYDYRFAYFYYEEDGINISTGHKLRVASKSTACFIFFLGLLLAVALVVVLADQNKSKQDSLPGWIKNVTSSTFLEDALLEVPVGLVTIFGFPLYVYYTAIGKRLL